METEFYLQARREWDERYGDLVLGKRNWQIASAGLMLLSLVLALGMVWTSARTKVIPYVVEVDKLGYALTIPAALKASSSPATVERMKRYEIAAVIRNARSVCSDPVVEQNMFNDLLAHAHGAADKFLESYFHADDFAKNPFQIMKHKPVSVQVQSILKTSARSYEVH
jgi:type IV secretory pathway TrbF-like protein